MARCEDFPCCGHEAGCCPDFDEAGRQLNMKCVCGATVPLTSHTSLCNSCLGLNNYELNQVVFDGGGDIAFTPFECDAEWGDW